MGLGHDRSDGDWEVMPLQRLKVGFPSGSDDKESAYSAGDVRDMGSIPGSGKVPCGRQWLPTPVFLSGESHGQRSLADYSPRSHKESDITVTNTNRLKVATEHAFKFKIVSRLLKKRL